MENLIFGLGVALIGILVVFVGLVILIGFIKILTMITTTLFGEKKRQKAQPAAPVTAPPVHAAPVKDDGVPADVIAAITAAVAAVWQGQTGFVVRRVKRVVNAPAWNRAGREEQTYSRF